MGNFNYLCGKCGWGPNGSGEDGRDYFGKPAQVIAETKDGKVIRMNGEYSGYGYVELPGGQEFYLKQYEEYWDGWCSYKGTDESGPYTSCDVLCQRCMYGSAPTSMTEYSLSDFQTVKEYLEKKKAPAPAVPAEAAKPKRVLKAPKKTVKAPTKEELVAKVDELQKEVDRLKPMERRLQELDKAYQKMLTTNQIYERRLKKVQEAVYGRNDYSSDEDY